MEYFEMPLTASGTCGRGEEASLGDILWIFPTGAESELATWLGGLAAMIEPAEVEVLEEVCRG